MAALQKNQSLTALVNGITVNKYYRSDAPAEGATVVSNGAGVLAALVGYDAFGSGFYLQIWDGAADTELLFELKVPANGSFALNIPLKFDSGLTITASTAQGGHTASGDDDVFFQVWYQHVQDN